MSTTIARMKAEIFADDAKFRASLKADEELLKKLGQTSVAPIGAGFREGESAVARLNATLKNAGEALQKVGTSLSIGLTAPLLLLGKQIADIGFSYEKAMNTFQAVTKATASEMAAAGRTAEQLGADMTLPATSAADAALAMTELAKGGFSAQQAMDASRGALQLAAAAQIEEARAAEITANAINTFGLAATDATRVSDLLAAASNASSAEITDIAQAMQQAGSSAAALHIPIQDLVTAIGEMANAGIKGSDAGTSLKTFMVALEPHTKAAAAAMKQLGIDAFDSSGKFVGLEAIIQQAAPALAKMTDEQRAHAIQTAFGTDAMRAANIILGQGVGKFQEMGAAVGQSGAAAELAAAKTKGLSGAWDGLKSQLETVGLKLFQSVSGNLEGLVRSVASAVEGISKLDSTVLRMGVAFAATAASAGPVALLAGKLLALGPQGAIVAAVIAGVSAIAAAYASNFSEMQGTLDSFAASLSRTFGGKGRDDLNAWSDLLAQLGVIGAETLDVLLTGLAQVAAILGGTIRANLALMKGDFAGAAAAIKEGWDGVTEAGDKFGKRLEQRGKELDIAMTSGAKGLMEYMRVVNSKGGGDAGNAFFTGYEAADPFGHIRQYSGAEMSSVTGYLRSTGFKAGMVLGDSLKSGAYDATHHSPFFMIHWLQEAADYAKSQAPTEFGKAGSKMGEKLREGFQAALGNINEWLGRAFGGTGTISDSVFDVMLRKFPKVVEELKNQAREFSQTNKAIELYSALMSTAAGRNTEFAQKVKGAFDRLLEFDRTLRENITPEMADLGGEIQSTTIITDKFGEAIRRVIGQDLERSILTLDKFKAGFMKVREAQEQWGKAMSDGVRKLKDDIKNELGDGVGTILIELANKFHWHLDKVKGWATDIEKVIGVLPQGFQNAVDKVLGTINKWMQFGDGVLGILKKLGFDVPATMGDLIRGMLKNLDFSKIINKVKEFGASFLSGLKNIFSSAAGVLAAGAGLFAASFGVGGIGGKLLGAGGGALIGAKLGSMIAPGIGTAIGAAAGAIFGGLFGGKKSKEQKEAEDRAKKQAALQVQDLYNAVNQGIIETMQKGAELLKTIEGYVDVPQKAIKHFMNQLELILTSFVEMSKSFKADGLAAGKAVTENLGDAFQFLLGGAELINAIKTIATITEENIKDFIATTVKIISRWLDAATQIELGSAKISAKIADKLRASFEFLKIVPDVIKSFSEAATVDDAKLDSVFTTAQKFVQKMKELSEGERGLTLNKAAASAGRFTELFNAGKTIFEFMKIFSEYKGLEGGTFDTINADFDKVTTWLDSTETLAASWKTRADNINSYIQEMVASLGKGLSSVTGIALNLSSGLAPTGAGASYVPKSSGQRLTREGGESSQGLTINIRVDGNLIHESRLEDTIRKAIENAKIRGYQLA